MQHNKIKLLILFALVFGSLLCIRLSYAAWSEPTMTPPEDNTAAPLTISTAAQNKTGPLSISSVTAYTAPGAYAPIYYDSNNTSYYLQPSNTGTSAVFAGKVGIGTNPVFSLDVRGAVGSTNAGSNSIYLEASDGSTGYGSRLRYGGAGTNVSIFEIQGVSDIPYLTINSGNVGIGTTSPVQLLSLYNTNADAAINFGTDKSLPTNSSPNFPGTTADDATIGTIAWTNTNNIEADDVNYAVASLTNGISPVYDNSIKLIKGGIISGTDQATHNYSIFTITDRTATFGSSSNLWGLTLTPPDINASDFGVAISFGSDTNKISHYLKAINFGFGIPSDVTINGISVEVNGHYSGGNGQIANVDYVRITVYYTQQNIQWTAGQDYSDSGKFKISNSSWLGTADHLVIDSSGDVGIGTAFPWDKLSVLSGSGDGVSFDGTASEGRILGYNGAGYNNLDIRTTGGVGSQLYLSTNGNVGIDTIAPGTTLHSQGANMGSTWAGDSTYYGGGKQHYYLIYGDQYGNGAAYTYGTPNSTSTSYEGGKAGGYFHGGFGYNYAGGGAGIVAIGGNGGISSPTAEGGAGIFAQGGVTDSTTGKYAYAGFFNQGDVIVNTGSVGIGNSTPTYRLQVGSSGDGTSAIANAWNTFSDRRFKTNIDPIPPTAALQDVLSLQGVTFNWINNNQPSIGFIAQDVQKILPQIVSADQQGYLSVDYSKMTPILVQAMKEQQNQIQNQQQEIEQQNTTITTQQQEIGQLQVKLGMQ